MRLVAWLASATVVLAIAVPAAIGSSAGASSHAKASAGTLVFCSDITYPPEEFYKGTKPTGSDIQIGTEVARLVGKKAVFDNTGFDGIIAALLSKKCDAIISGMSSTPARKKQIDFVDYLHVGQSLMANKHHPEHVSSLAALSGKAVAEEVGTTELALLQAANKQLKKAGKKAIDIVSFPKDTDAANALKTGKVDFYFGDSPVVAYYTTQNPKDFQFGSPQFAIVPVAIGIRKNDSAKASIAKAINTMYANKSMCRILAQWHMSGFALPPHKC